MGYRNGYRFLFSCLVLFSYALFVEFHGAQGYRNYTVGDSLGWYDDLMEPRVDYQKWAVGKYFGLGDFLIFNTDKNHSVVQTYNETTYKRCDYDDAEEDDTTEWSAGEPTFDSAAVTVPVPLLKVGSNFFFSGNYDGEQCRHGQHFVINVTHGQGLPPSLDPSEGSPAPTSGDEGDAVPETVVPSNFKDPEGAGDVKATAGAARLMVGNETIMEKIGLKDW
ncbi:hypothetical protein HPP92_003586 [Vanilla planifolia]|uniref:Phytocyanin domain-containing protein n=1 Tax=Vanilla planifolia TaxID=51239 RepID=A0A835VJ35_VANPL|nr:hypothetical protein HPP92_003586 [Vanilla planifolia]